MQSVVQRPVVASMVEQFSRIVGFEAIERTPKDAVVPAPPKSKQCVINASPPPTRFTP